MSEYWAKKDKDGKITTVESHSWPHVVPGAVRISKKAYDAYIVSLPPAPEPPPARDLAQEIDLVKERVTELADRIEELLLAK